MRNAVQAVADRNSPISEMAMTCLAHCPDPDMVEQIGRIFIQTAREMRGVMAGGMGNA